MYRQLDIYWIDLEPTRGAETKKKRPCVVVQSDLMNRGTRTVIVAPILPGHKQWPFVINVIPTKTNGLDKKHHINLKQLRAVDVSRINNKQGTLGNQYKEAIQDALQLIFGAYN